MDKIRGWIWHKVLSFKLPENIKSLSLLELLMAIVVVSVMVLSFYSLQSFSSKELTTSNRRAKIQNNLTLCLEHMSKYVQQANGNMNSVASPNPAIKLYPVGGPYTGFQVRYDCKDTQTPSDLTDDVWIYYFLSGNNLKVGCSGANCGSCGVSRPVPPVSPNEETLSNKIVANFSNTLLPAVGPTDNTGFGLYVVVDPLGNSVDVGLVGRYYPAVVPTLQTRSQNPQIAIKTKLICNNSSTN